MGNEIIIRKISFDDLPDYITKHKDIAKNRITFSKSAIYFGSFTSTNNALVGVYSYVEYSTKIKLKSGFVLPEFRRKGIYNNLQRHILEEVKKKGKPIFSNSGIMNIMCDLKNGGIILKYYKSKSFLVRYE